MAKYFQTHHTVFAVAVVVVYILLRLWNLTDSCLWFDELFSVHAAEMGWQNLFWFVAQDLIHPPLFYVLLKIWIFVGGESLLWLRLFPLIFSVIAIFPFLKFFGELRLLSNLKQRFWTGLLALSFFAVNGSLIKYAQEIRMYSLLMCLALFSAWLFARLLNGKKGLWILISVNILLIYTHYFGWFVIASEVLAILILAREKLKEISIMLAATVASFAPWTYAIWQASKINSNVGQNIGWMSKPNFRAIFQFVFDLFEPIYFQNSDRESAAIFLITSPIIVVCLVAFCFYIWCWKNESALEKRNFLLLLIYTVTPVILAFVISWLAPFSIWGTRHLIIVFAPLTIALAVAFAKIELRQIKIAAISLVFLLFTAAFAFQATRRTPKYIWCAWENLASNLPQTQIETTTIYAFEDLVAYHFWFALHNSDRKFQVVKINNIEGINEDKAYFLPRGFDEIPQTTQFEGERFFVAFRAKEFNRHAPPLQNLIQKGYEISDTQIYESEGWKAFLVEIRKAKP